MIMLPVCSAASSCSHPQILFPGSCRPCSPFWKDFVSRCNLEENVVFGMSNGTHPNKFSFKAQATRTMYSNFVESPEVPTSLFNLNNRMSDAVDSNRAVNESCSTRSSQLIYVEDASFSQVEEGLGNLLTENATDTIAPVDPETISTVDRSLENNGSFSDVKTNFDDFFSGLRESLGFPLNKGENAVENTLDKISSSVTSITKKVSEAVDDVLGRAFSAADETGDLAESKLTNFSGKLKEASSKGPIVAVHLLRQTIGTVENSLTNGVSFLVYSYGSAKEVLPPNIRSNINLFERKATEVLSPVGAALQQVYVAIEGWERNLGVNPDDPIVHFVLFVGTSGTLWVFYWLWAYSGYAGDVSPKSTLELLTSREKSVLIDIRPEVLREKDGIPDLRRAARFRYASVTLPEVDGALRKMLKSGREVDDVLTAVVIRNLKTVQDRSKVIIMDADGTRSKGIARALKKLGIKRPYLVRGGFKSWTKEGLRTKELKPETTLSILNEEAEAILEDISPSPLQVFGLGVGLVGAVYALLEWEKTLQLIGVIGLGQNIYRRVASYEKPDDFKQDVRLLLGPVRFGVRAFSWAAGKLEKNRVGLPTSPSSSDVQSRVLQAAAKHESQPSDSEGLQEPSPEGVAPASENVDLSEA